VKIIDVKFAGLKGATPKGGWTEELKPDSVVHTLISIKTDCALFFLDQF
jgi:hypothetical protein